MAVDLVTLFSTLDFFQIVALFLVVSVILTALFKKYKIGQTFFIITMLRTKKANPIFDKFSKNKKLLEWFADIGLILGFGAIAADYLWGRKLSAGKRIALFIASFLVLNTFIRLVFATAFSSSPLIFFDPEVLYFVYGIAGFAGFAIALLFYQAVLIIQNYLQGKLSCPGIAPVIPGVAVPNVPVFVPAHVWISLLLILIVHEGMHGVLARKIKLKVKSAGILLLGFLPVGAFVEPDERALVKVPDLDQLRIYAAGATANLASYALGMLAVLAVFGLIFTPFFAEYLNDTQRDAFDGVYISGVQETVDFCRESYPAPAFGVLEKGMQITALNGFPINSLQDFITHLRESSSNTFTIRAEDASEHTITLEKNEVGSYGFIAEEKIKDNYAFPEKFKLIQFVFGFFLEFMNWFILFSLLVAMLNFIPVEPFDGGKIAKLLYTPYFLFLGLGKKDTKKFLSRILVTIVLALFIINALPLFF